MIISLRHHFVFLCMPKTGTTSLEAALRPHSEIVCDGPPALKHVSFSEFQMFFLPLLEAKAAALNLDPAGLDVVAAFREPIEWRYSWYRYRLREKLAAKSGADRQRYAGDVSFHDFLEEHFSENPRPFARLRSPAGFLLDKDGKPGNIRLFRYEAMDHLVDFLQARIGRPLKLSHRNVSPIPADEAEIRRARDVFGDRLKAEYAIYNAIA